MAREAPWVGETLDGLPCDQYERDPGRAHNYNEATRGQGRLELVERHHFTEEVRSLRPGSRHVPDLDYTIRWYPNHHPALYTMIRYATEEIYAERAEEEWSRTDRDGRAYTPPECMLQRAINYAPEDHRVRVLAGLFFHRLDHFEEARAHYDEAVSLAPESAEAHYNLGLLLTDMERYEEAREHARAAYRLGYPLDGLRNRLARAGHSLED